MNFSSASAPQSVNATASSGQLVPRASSDGNMSTVTLRLNESDSVLLTSTVTVFSSSLSQAYQPTSTFNSPTTQSVNGTSPPATGRFQLTLHTLTID